MEWNGRENEREAKVRDDEEKEEEDGKGNERTRKSRKEMEGKGREEKVENMQASKDKFLIKSRAIIMTARKTVIEGR